MNIIPFGDPLPHSQNNLSLISYNILLPNNTEGWWIPKCYPPQTPLVHRMWPHRKKKILDFLHNTNADIICLQEVAQSSWKEDFQKLWSNGYEGVIHRKNNLFRCATFFKNDVYTLLETRHSFRSLVHLFEGPLGTFGIINVHLSGGPRPKIRMAQLHEALQALKKLSLQFHEDLDTLPVILCGDFNCNPNASVMSQFLQSGILRPDDRDPLYPQTALTKKGKKHRFHGFESVYQKALKKSPPTLFGRSLVSIFCKPHTTKELLHARSTNTLSTLINEKTFHAITSLFSHYAIEGVMDKSACSRWIQHINGELRGGEWRMVQKKNHRLTKDDFTDIYIDNLSHGLWWSLASDLEQHNIPLPYESTEVYHDSLDHIFARACSAVAIHSPDLPTKIPNGLPCSEYPSDHIPVGATISLNKKTQQVGC